MFYLVTQRTEKGLQTEKQHQLDKVYGTRNKFHFDEKIWNRVSKVTSEVFEEKTKIREWFKSNRENFSAGTSEKWDSWLNGSDSTESTLSQCEGYKIWFMDCNEFEALEAKQKQQIGF
jgi:hypothetical protein